jgi:hypothetical protein
MISVFGASVAANRFAARVPPAIDVGADLGRAIVVPLDDPGLATRVLPALARIAQADGGLLVPIHVVTPEDPDSLATARGTSAAIDRAASAAGIEAEPSLRVAASIGQGIRNAVATADGTLLVLTRPEGLAAQDVIFGGIESEHVAASHVPTVVYLPDEVRVTRVVVPIRRRDVAPEGIVDARVALELAIRFEKAGLDVLVGVQADATLPPDVRVPNDVRPVEFSSGRVEWVRSIAGPGDLVLLPAALESLVIGLDASRISAIDGVGAAIVAGPHRSGVYAGNRESVAAIETVAT